MIPSSANTMFSNGINNTIDVEIALLMINPVVVTGVDTNINNITPNTI
jgi:hypothetical protein